MIVELEFRDAQKPSPEIRADFIGREFGEGDEKGFLREVFGIFQVVDPSRQVSTDQQPVLADKQAETILLTPEHLLDDGIGIKVFRTFVHYVPHMFGKSSILRNFYLRTKITCSRQINIQPL